MVVVLFRSRQRPDIDAKAYQQLQLEMLGIVSNMPGFIAVDVFTARDGESLILAKFETEEAVDQWREHAAHLEAQGRGRDEFYASYTVQVCEVIREYGWGGGAT